MDTAFVFFHGHVHLLYYRLLETAAQVSTLSTLLPLIVVIFVIAVGVVVLNQHFQKNVFQHKLEQEETKNRHQQEMLRSSILVQEQERKRIAQDLHDELGALLSILRMHLVHLEEKEKHQTETVVPALQNIRSLAENAISAMRKISHELMPPQLETFGLVKTIESVAATVNKTGRVTIYMDVNDRFEEPGWPVRLGLYRILMELINNTLKHTQADSIEIQLDKTEEHIVCVYTDNGLGMPEGEQTGLGHKSIHGRASSLGGHVEISAPGEALRVVITLGDAG